MSDSRLNGTSDDYREIRRRRVYTIGSLFQTILDPERSFENEWPSELSDLSLDSPAGIRASAIIHGARRLIGLFEEAKRDDSDRLILQAVANEIRGIALSEGVLA
jgi:hypothetical protein